MIITQKVSYYGKTISYDELKPSSKIKIIVECDNCHKLFNSTKFQITRNGHQFCQKCKVGTFNRIKIPTGSTFNQLTVLNEGTTPGTYICKCICGNIKEIRSDLLKYNQVKSCGCLRKTHASQMMTELNKTRTPETHPNWKGGKSPERDRFEKSKLYKMVRKEVLVSKNYTCEKCGSTQNIGIHHIKSFKEYPSLRADKSNLACLCDSCHRSFHKIYGKKGINDEDFIKFLNS